MKRLGQMLKTMAVRWLQDDVIEYSASLAYFTIFSLAPLLFLVIAIVGMIYGQDAVRQQVLDEVRVALGERGAQYVDRLIEQASQPGSGLTASIIGIATLLLGATRIFGQLKKMLNRIWDVEPPPTGIVKGYVNQKIRSFLMVFGVGLLLLVLIVASTVASAVTTALGGYLGYTAILLQAANLVVSICIFTLLFAMLFKFLPDATIAWRDLWVGALVTSVFFNIGKHLIGLYLSHGSLASIYGAAGSLVVILVFFFYSALILFTGAEFTQAYATCYGSRRGLKPAPESRDRLPEGEPAAVAVAPEPEPRRRRRRLISILGLWLFHSLRRRLRQAGKA